MNKFKYVAMVAMLLGVASMAGAGNGHMLHGFGPVNSTMGGAGVALAIDPVGALMFNPALMNQLDGDKVTFSTEFFEDGIEIEVVLNDGTRGEANPSNQVGVLPSIGWTSHQPGSKMSFGFGLVAVAGFRTDYPEDPSSILFNTPPYGFGRIWTDYRVTRVPLALAFQATPKLSVGASLNGYLGELGISPLPHKVYDANPGDDGARYYPLGGGLDSSTAFALQAGFLYQMNDALAFGGSITTAQDFSNYRWNSTIANPNDPNYGQHRALDYDLDGPMNATVGVGFTPNPMMSVAFDVMYIEYRGVNGFGGPGGVQDRVVWPFGWRNVMVYKTGLEMNVSDKLSVRAGYNYSDIPIRNEVVISGTGAPSMFKHHFSAGVGFKLNDKVTADMGFYIVPRESVTGPFPDLDNNQLGTMTTSNKLTSVQMGFRWEF